MNDLLNKLIEIDKKAQQLDDELKKEAENLDNQIQEEVESIRIKHMKSADETIANESKIMREAAEKQWNENNIKYDNSKKELEMNFNNNFDRWVDSIVEDVLS